MRCDNVMMMCISFLFIELYSNQVCFLHRRSLLCKDHEDGVLSL